MSELIINPYEAVELIGVGEGDSFKGWLVLNRRIYGRSKSIISTGERYLKSGVPSGTIARNNDTIIVL